ncbi:MAG: hypothetical protein P4L59_00855 [Desulfosporosinus sp.]|nr:hypothetical protein [Desulfosporosinus sp.]
MENQDKAGMMTIKTETISYKRLQGDGFFIFVGMGVKSLAALLPMPFHKVTGSPVQDENNNSLRRLQEVSGKSEGFSSSDPDMSQ